MINSVSANLAYPYTLVSLYKRYFLTSEDINLLINENCTEEVDRILNKAGLESMVRDKHDEDLCQYADDKMDSLFLSQFFKQSINVVRAFSGLEHQFLLYWLRQVEINNIKTILRGKAMHRDSELIAAQLFELDAFSTLSTDKLLQAEDVSEVLRQLELTPYAALARYTMSQYDEQRQLFSLETSVDKQFFIGLIRRLNMLDADDKSAMHPLVGRVIDHINLVRLMRYRFNYELSPSHTYFLLSSGGFRLKQQELLQLVKINNLQGVLEELPRYLSETLHIKSNQQLMSKQSINYVMEKEVVDYAQRILGTKPFSLASVFAYLIIRRYQLFQIHAILKGKAMHMDKQTILFAIGMK